MGVATLRRSPLRCFAVEVAAVRRLSPSFVRITFRGDALREFGDGTSGDPAARRTFDDLRVKLIIPPHRASPPVPLDLGQGWYPRWLAQDPALRGCMRTYTVRTARLDGDEPQLDVDFVLHLDPDGAGGAAAVWAAGARPGDQLMLLGPTAHVGGYGGAAWQPPPGDPDAPVRVLLAGDETAAPAICAILEGLPAGYAGHAVIEVPAVDDALPVATASAVEQVWLPREGVAHGESLCTAVRRLLPARPAAQPVRIPEVDVDRELLWDVADAAAPGHDPGDPSSDPGRTAPAYAWVAGEAATVRDIRRHLVGAVRLPRRSVSFMGYWRQGRTEG